MSIFKNEPVAVVASVASAVTSVLGAGVLFGAWHFTADQIAAAALAVTSVLTVPVTLFVRNSVTPTAKVPVKPVEAESNLSDILPGKV